MRAIVMLCMLGAALAQYSWHGPDRVDDATDNVCLLDTGSCSCCYMQKEMYKLTKHINDTLNELQGDLMEAQTAVNQRRSCQYAFSVALTGTRRCVGPYRADTIVMYKHVLTNLGNVYQPSSGVFTAPRSGIYYLALTAYSDAGIPNAPLAICVQLVRNMVVEVALSERYNEDQEDSISTSLLLHLQNGDNVFVQLVKDCFLCDDDNSFYNTFTGYLVYPTD